MAIPKARKSIKLNKTCGGYTTKQGREDWLCCHGIKDKQLLRTVTESMDADLDHSKPLYYWQLYSILGHHHVRSLVKDFYRAVYADKKNKWFRDAFTDISDIDHHIHTQTAFWIDSFGGGAQYHGGDYSLSFHHEHNAGHIMTAEGAELWMIYMKNTILRKGYLLKFHEIDSRINHCIVDFLRTKMMKYADQFRWKFDNTPFEELFNEVAKLV